MQKNKWKIFVQYQNNWIDITSKKIVVYGAGQGCIDMMNTLQLSNIEIIVDGAKEKQDKKIMIANNIILIQSPHILKNLSPKEYFVIISSTRYKQEIKAEINQRTNGKMLSCLWNEDIFYAYETIEEMFLFDPIINKKLLMFHLSFQVCEIIDKFYQIKKTEFSENVLNCFVPIGKGESKLVFLFGNIETMWVFSIRGLFSSTDNNVICKYENHSYMKKVSFLNKYLQDNITVYRDKTGIMIQKYAYNKLDLKKQEIQKAVMLECRKVHSIKTDELEELDFTERFYRVHRSRICSYETGESIIFEKLDSIAQTSISILNNSNKKCLIHGDLTEQNIVMHKGKIIFIDWEYLSIGNPMIDVCYFLYRLQYIKYLNAEISFETLCKTCFSELSNFVEMYCQDNNIVEEYMEDARGVLTIYFISLLLNIYLKNNREGIKKIMYFISEF